MSEKAIKDDIKCLNDVITLMKGWQCSVKCYSPYFFSTYSCAFRPWRHVQHSISRLGSSTAVQMSLI